MKPKINSILACGFGGFLTGMLAFAPGIRAQQPIQPDTALVEVLGTGEDARFEPATLQVNPGDVIRFEVLEGLHTVTAYHPDNRRSLRIPAEAASFDSGPLESGAVWFLQLKQEGTYDYFCLPHERFGHVGRVIVGNADSLAADDKEDIPANYSQKTDR